MDEKTYGNFIVPYRYALNLVTSHLKNMQSELLMSTEIRNPIDSIYSRIKARDSIKKKCKKPEYNLDSANIESVQKRMHDIAGVRITCIYKRDIERIADYIGKIPGVFTLITKDYVNHPKPNGYQSLHLVILIDVPTLTSGMMKIPVEIQIRTVEMQAWAQVEHRAWYKSDAKHLLDDEQQATLTAKLKEAADLATKLSELYDEILLLSGEE